LLVDDAQHDSWATANALAARIKTLPHDIVLFGWNSVDNQSAATGQMTAEILGLGSVSVAVSLEVIDGVAQVDRLAAQGNRERYSIKLPAVITCTKGLNKPRSANMKGIMQAKKTAVPETPAGAPADGVAIVRLDPPPPRPAGKIVGKGPEAAAQLVKLLRAEAKVI
jgi:electron transfer flavoprotein beta subunit